MNKKKCSRCTCLRGEPAGAVRGLERVALHTDLTMLARFGQVLSRARAVPLAALGGILQARVEKRDVQARLEVLFQQSLELQRDSQMLRAESQELQMRVRESLADFRAVIRNSVKPS